MKQLVTKFLFTIASWLYNAGIVAPQLLEHRTIIVLTPEESKKLNK